MFKALTGRQPEDEDELEVLAGDSHTYSIQYVFEASSHSTNLTVRRLFFSPGCWGVCKQAAIRLKVASGPSAERQPLLLCSLDEQRWGLI